MRTRYFQFRLRTLLLATTVIAAFAGVLGSQIRGRLQTEGDPPYFTDFGWCNVRISSGSAPTLAFVFRSEEEARKFEEQFDRQQFISDLRTISASNPKPAHQALEAISVNSFTLNEIVCLKYDFPRWGRYRFDARRMTYVFDLNDPIADWRNAQVHNVFWQTAEAIAQENPKIVRLHQNDSPPYSNP